VLNRDKRLVEIIALRDIAVSGRGSGAEWNLPVGRTTCGRGYWLKTTS